MVGEHDVSPIRSRAGPHATAPPFAPRGPLGRFPHFIARTAALRLLDAPTASLCLERPFRLSGDDEISQVPGQPLRTCHGLGPRWAGLAEVPGYAPCVLTKPVLPSASTNASATTT